MAEKILPITKRANIGLVINDHLEIAREIGADICHLGQEDFFDAGYKNISELKSRDAGLPRPLGAPGSHSLPELKIGLSTHAPEQAQRSLDAGADYLAIGPVYATGTKPGAKPVSLITSAGRQRMRLSRRSPSAASICKRSMTCWRRVHGAYALFSHSQCTGRDEGVRRISAKVGMIVSVIENTSVC